MKPDRVVQQRGDTEHSDTPPSIVSCGCLAVLVAVYACVCQCMFVSSCPRKVSKMLRAEEQRENAAANMTIFCTLGNVYLPCGRYSQIYLPNRKCTCTWWVFISDAVLQFYLQSNTCLLHWFTVSAADQDLTKDLDLGSGLHKRGQTKFLCAVYIRLSFLTFTLPLLSSTAALWFKNHSPANQCTTQQRWCKHTLWGHWSFYVS